MQRLGFVSPGCLGRRAMEARPRAVAGPPHRGRTRVGRRPLLALAAGARLPGTEVVVAKDAMEFFRYRQGTWDSWRVTHHLAFRRDETGMSEIEMTCLEADDERIVALCKDHDVDPETAQGGCYVTWKATMAWDQEGENHEGSTVFALCPESDDVRKGKILRDRGYAEIVPIAGSYYMDEEDRLNLVTPYDGGEVIERFAFDGPDIVNRVSTVKRFGGFATATFATERRKGMEAPEDEEDWSKFTLFGAPPPEEGAGAKSSSPYARSGAMYGARAAQGPPSRGSAFSSGFSGDSAQAKPTPDVDLSKVPPSMRDAYANSAAEPPSSAKANSDIDLSKVPPSMRGAFADSLAKDAAASENNASSD